MIIHHPILGPRDAQEFVYLGDASLINRPDGMTAGVKAFHDYAYNRDNPAGVVKDLWYHEAGCAQWLVVTRNTVTHAVSGVDLVAERKP
ncbi:MAG: sarcosine oxidase subunit delta [Rhodobacterales bacterium 17-64-5]|nr:MAG: sarcosine oxidase subunit delta [Rhodobacterales bacterium 17-64-5]